MSPLSDLLARRIRAQGPLTIAEFMTEALGHPDFGYYMTRDPLGRRGDFTTAPEISQIFGELIGLWCADLWERMGRPDPLVLAELGPGRGTLVADALRAARVQPGFLAASRLHLVETSPVLRHAQRKTLRSHEAAGHAIVWHDTIATLPSGPALVIANEFFDALPIRQFVKTESGWREKFVGLSAEEDAFVFAVPPGSTPSVALVPPTLRDAPAGSTFEAGTAALSIADALARRHAAEGGATLVIDYGHVKRATGETLQAVRRHKACPPLAEPGEADLTAHVDFAALAEAARGAGARIYGPAAQGAFLERLGIAQRAERLLRSAAPGQAADIGIAVRRLIDPKEMGTLFKVLCMAAPDLPVPAGFS